MIDFLENAVNRASVGKPVATAVCTIDASTGKECCSTSLGSIYQVLIAATGRFVESNAADLLISIPHIENHIHDLTTTHDTVYFGLRRNGVDHKAYIELRAFNDGIVLRDYYRRIYAVVIDKTEETDGFGYYINVTISLFEISDNISCFEIEAANRERLAQSTALT